MPHNPRRRRVPDAPDAALTRERIAAALERAAALRRETAVDPDAVRTVPLTPADAARSTAGRRRPAAWDRPAERDPWILVGWVRHEQAWAFADEADWDRYDRTWDVWLNPDDGRVWLKPARWGRRPKDDPFP